MSKRIQNEQDKMLDLFVDDFRENIVKLEEELNNLEQNPKNEESINEIYRIFHTLKGNSASVQLTDLSELFHNLETLFDNIRTDRIEFEGKIADVVIDSIDVLERVLNLIADNKNYQTELNPYIQIVDELIKSDEFSTEELEKRKKVKALFEKYGIEDFTSKEINYSLRDVNYYLIKITLEKDIKLKLARVFVIIKNLVKENINILNVTPDIIQILEGKINLDFQILIQTKESSKKIKKIITDSGDVAKVEIKDLNIDEVKKMVKPSRSPSSFKVKRDIRTITESETINVKPIFLDRLLEYFGELLINTKQLDKLLETQKDQRISDILFRMQSYMFNLQDLVLDMQLIPISRVFRPFQRVVRQLSSQYQKKIRLNLKTNEVRVDRKIISDLSEILTHILRNAVYHGIESPSERIAKKKPALGTIQIETTIESNILHISIMDDGAGIDLEKIKQKAIQLKLYPEEKLNEMSNKELLDLLFTPYFTTAKDIDMVSGRGVGLNAVSEKVLKLGGKVEIETEKDWETVFHVYIPFNRSLIRSLLIKSGNQTYAIPLDDIQRIFMISKKQIIENNGELYISVDDSDEFLKLRFLNRLFGKESVLLEENKINLENIADNLKVVYIKKASSEFALVVDDFIKETEIVVKKIDMYNNEIFGISGAAILEDGTVSMILDTLALNK